MVEQPTQERPRPQLTPEQQEAMPFDALIDRVPGLRALAARAEEIAQGNTKKRSLQLRTIRIVFGDPATGDSEELEMPHGDFWSVYQSLKAVGVEHTSMVALYGASLVKPDLTTEDTEKIARKIGLIVAFLAHQSDPEQTALEFSYQLLRNSKISREAAAEFASDILGTEVPTDSWRKRVDKYASDRGLPKVQLTRGRRKGKKSER